MRISYLINFAENVSRGAHDVLIKNLSDNIVNVSTGVRNLSNQMETTLAAPKTEPVNAPSIPTTLQAPQHAPTGTSDPPTGNISSSKHVFTHQPPGQLSHENFPNIKNWFKKGYSRKRKAGTKGLDNDPNSEGNKSSILSSYMVDENGQDIPEEEKDNARTTARGFFNFLLENNRAPATWEDSSIDVRNEYIYVMETHHPFLRYCQGHWKAIQIATNTYHGWTLTRIGRSKKTKAKRGADTEAIDIDAGENEGVKASKRPQEDGGMVQEPSKRPRVEEARPTPRPRPHSTKTIPQGPKVRNSVYIVRTLHRTRLTGLIVRIFEPYVQGKPSIDPLSSARASDLRQQSK